MKVEYIGYHHFLNEHICSWCNYCPVTAKQTQIITPPSSLFNLFSLKKNQTPHTCSGLSNFDVLNLNF